MNEPHNRILIEGVGSIGGVIAGRLIRAGQPVTLVTGNAAITAALNTDGLRLIARERTSPHPLLKTLPIHAFTTLAEAAAERPFQTALLCMKATAVIEAARQTVPHLAPDGCLVTFQNGIVEDAVMEAAGAERVIGGIIGWGGSMIQPGIYEQTSPGATFIGEMDGRLTARVSRLGDVLRAVGPVTISRNMRGVLWSKLAISCTINALGAITGQPLGAMLKDRAMRRLFLRTYGEVVETADALGIRLEKVAADPRLLYLPAGGNPLLAAFKDAVVRVVGRKYGQVRVSTLQSLERGRRTEIDFLNGYVVDRAAGAGVSVPLNAALLDMVHEIEAGTRHSSPANIGELQAVLP